MAKGSLNGVMTGKKGNTVFYRIKNSSNKEKQGSREYTPTISNPKTMAQAIQRLKLAPANAFYRAFQGLLNHSWQGVAYGGRSHSKFMSEVLKGDFLYPYLLKGDTSFVPGEYPVSRGSLPSLKVLDIDLGNSIVASAIKIPADTFADGTDASISYEEFLQDSPAIKSGLLSVGDQLTVAYVQRVDGEFVAGYREIVLDASKYAASTLAGVFAETGISIDFDKIYLNNFVTADQFRDGLTDVVAAAVIVSRPQVSNTSSTVNWLRSNADMFVLSDVLVDYCSQARYNAAIASYMGQTASVDSSWYLNQGTTRGEGNTEFPDVPNAVINVRNELLQLSTVFTGLPTDTAGRSNSFARLVSIPLGLNAIVAEVVNPEESGKPRGEIFFAETMTISGSVRGVITRDIDVTGTAGTPVGFVSGLNVISYDTALELLNRYGGIFEGETISVWD